MTYLEKFHREIVKYYRGKIMEFGATARGVDWNGEESQKLRLEVLIELSDHLLIQKCRVLDYGCGYGELATKLQNQNYEVDYTGYDLVEESLAEARKRFSNQHNIKFTSSLDMNEKFDVIFASGVFNLRFGSSKEWLFDYIKPTLSEMCLKSSFLVLNFLKPNPTKPSAKLFFPSLKEIGSVLPKKYRVVETREDYGLWEWSALIERDGEVQ
jgi:ubiquinone/menaquinone biosynthesis C-methylase UbiE